MPRFTPEQVRRRQLVAGVLALTLLLVLGGCTAALIGAIRGDGAASGATQREPFQADDDALAIATTPTDAAALENLPGDIELGADETMGLDVSAHQGEIDWAKVSADGFTVAYIKATEGTGYTDATFQQNWDGARAAGLTTGAYHYFTLCSSGSEQAEDFLAAAPPDDSALPPALDLEFDGACEDRPEGVDAQTEIDDFTAAVEKAWGRRLIIYSSSDWRQHYGLPVTGPRPDWLYSERARPPQADWAVWQVRFDGTVSGISGGVDIDVVRAEQVRRDAEIAEGDGAISHAEEG
ncbi:glycoside hydrolase family 25 protein [Brachybacterium tyrofermentans]|uniref:glycoside hydrolase family 25 protein n=1 Tax=Brachybacterium tyrofermentans TaxID=47848 RepID=UPI003FD43294